MEYKKNLFRGKDFFDKKMVITDQGQWAVLDKELVNKINNNQIINKQEHNICEKKGLIITDNNLSGIIKRQRNNYIHLFNGTSLHIVVPTIRCNHKCIYCHSSAKPERAEGYDIDVKTAKQTVDFIFQTPSKAVTIEFQGGEPLLRFDIIKEIVSYAKEKNKKCGKNLRFDLVSNLSLLDHDILKYLIKEEVGLCTSLDGPEKLHNMNRTLTGGNSYKNTTYWINEIKNNYNYPINALMVTTKHSLPYAKEIVDEYALHGLKYIKIRHLDSLGYAKNVPNIDYSADEYLKFWRKAVDHIVKNYSDFGLIETFVQLIIKKVKGINPNYSDFESPCGAVLGQLAYSYNGDIYTCDEGRQYDIFKIGNVKTAKYKEIIKSNSTCGMVLSSLNDSLECNSCVYKPFCGVCPVCNYSEENNLIPKLATNKRCKIYKGIFDYVFDSLLHKSVYSKVFESWA